LDSAIPPRTMRPMAEPLQFVVIGAGNMGCVYGGNLGRIGQKIAFVDVWKEHVEAIRLRGLKLEGLTGDFTIRAHAAADTRETPRADVALVCVNSYSTADAARAAKSVLKDDGCCLTLQNGVGNVEILTEILGTGRVLAGLSFQSGDIQGPGHVRHTNNGPTYIGELDRSRSPRLNLLNELFTTAGMNPVLVEDVMRTIWTKFIHNCGINALCAITGLRPGHIRHVADLDEFQTRIIQETLALVRAKGIEPTEPDPVSAIKEYCSHKFHRPSMMQHLDRGKPTEIDALNGYVARESRRLGLAAPYSDALTMLIKGRQYVAPIGENVG
jgi:2-dehydropantoate 2-reductase